MRSGSGRPTSRSEAERLLLALLRRQQAMRLEHLGDLVADPHQRIERRHRLLEHHGDAAAAQAEPAVLVEGQQVLAVEHDLAGLGDHGVGQQAHQRMGAHRLAGAGFADHAKDLAGGEIERNAVHGVGAVAAGRQRQLEVLDGDGGVADMLSVRPC